MNGHDGEMMRDGTDKSWGGLEKGTLLDGIAEKAI